LSDCEKGKVGSSGRFCDTPSGGGDVHGDLIALLIMYQVHLRRQRGFRFREKC